MINKLRSNYKLSNALVRVFFVLSYVFYSWYKNLSGALVTIALMQEYATYTGLYVLTEQSTLWLAFSTSLFSGVILVLIVPIVVNWYLNFSRFYKVPQAEYTLIALLFCTLYFVVCGALNLINLITPLLVIWGNVIFPVIVSLGCIIWFYRVTVKLYFNDVTELYYFRSVAVLYLVITAVVTVGTII